MKPSGSSAVMSVRKSPRKTKEERQAKQKAKHFDPIPPTIDRVSDPRRGLDFFPTPPWSTRGFLDLALPLVAADFAHKSVWEPCCGEGHMAEVLGERFGRVHASDVYPHGYGAVGSFVGAAGLDLDIARCPWRPDWIITNPPYNLAIEVAERALVEAREGVALLVRTLWIESAERFDLFRRHQPTLMATYAERVPMVEFRWDPEASSATSYSWIVWAKVFGDTVPAIGLPSWQTVIIPPICRDTYSRPGDIARFSGPRPPDLFGATP